MSKLIGLIPNVGVKRQPTRNLAVYDDCIVMYRAGLTSQAAPLSPLLGALGGLLRSKGKQEQSVAEMSPEELLRIKKGAERLEMDNIASAELKGTLTYRLTLGFNDGHELRLKFDGSRDARKTLETALDKRLTVK